MRKTDVMGIVFPNVHDQLMGEMTAHRSMGSIPFGGRYRIIDFSLSNLVNAGVSKVGIITKSKYQSLMDHIGSGKPWDLDRKYDGLYLFPPFSGNDTKVYVGHADALAGVMKFLESSSEKYVVLCDADVLVNFDLSKMIEQHIENAADITVAYKFGQMPKSEGDIMSLVVEENGAISDIKFPIDNRICNYSLDILVMERQFLINSVKKCAERNETSFQHSVLQPNLGKINIRGYEVQEYAAVMDAQGSYMKISRELLYNPEARKQLFSDERPVFTKTRDNMPTKYGLESKVENSMIADGCVIEGEVKNCIIFRGVKIGKGAVVENSVIMQDTVIEEQVELDYVTLDKNVKITEGKTIKGAESYPVYVRKEAVV